MTKVGIIGASGFAGIELVRILAFHPHVEIAYLTSRTHAGKKISQVVPDLAGICDKELIPTPLEGADVVFLAVPHGTGRVVLDEFPYLCDHVVVDLSSDHRRDPTFVYGLPERNRERIRTARRIANPGCFATALALSLLPLAEENKVPPIIHASGITGSTGAGAALSPTLHFSWRHGNAQAYSILCHRHSEEVRLALGLSSRLHFVPYRGALTRGIITTVVLESCIGVRELIERYRDYYASHALVGLSEDSPDLKRVVGTARAILHVTSADDAAAIVCVLDNMLKGAAAQAVQNMNLALGYDEYTALPLRCIGW